MLKNLIYIVTLTSGILIAMEEISEPESKRYAHYGIVEMLNLAKRPVYKSDNKNSYTLGQEVGWFAYTDTKDSASGIMNLDNQSDYDGYDNIKFKVIERDLRCLVEFFLYSKKSKKDVRFYVDVSMITEAVVFFGRRGVTEHCWNIIDNVYNSYKENRLPCLISRPNKNILQRELPPRIYEAILLHTRDFSLKEAVQESSK